MSTLSDLRSRIADDLNRSDLNTQIDKAINRAITHYRKRKFWFNETTGTFLTVAGQQSYTTSVIPSDILHIHRLEYSDGNTSYEVIRASIDYIRNLTSTSGASLPTWYAWYGGKIYFALIPSAVGTVTIYYDKSYSDLTSSDSNDFTVYAEDLIEARARWWIYNRIIRDADEAVLAKQEELDALQGLDIQTSGKIATGYVAPTQF